MTTDAKLKIYNVLKSASRLVWVAAGLCILVWIVYLFIRSNEDVADYQALEVGKPTVVEKDLHATDVVSVQAGQEVSYTLTWKKKVGSPGNLYRSWLRMKYANGQWVRDTTYPPILQSASFRVGRGAGQYTQTSTIEAPLKSAYYTLQIRAEYDRVLGADASTDEKTSNVVRVVAAPTLDLQGQIDALRAEVAEVRTQMSSRTSANPPVVQSVSPTTSQTPQPVASVRPLPSASASPSPSPAPASTPRPCVIGLLGLCILGGI